MINAIEEVPRALDTDQGRLACIVYRPAAVSGVGIVLCNPLFEARKSTHRVMVNLARALARDGHTVLRFDYRGCGESDGEFGAYAFTAWKRDIELACAALRQMPGCRHTGLLGLRAGASLAWLAAPQMQPDFIVLWEPVVNGSTHLLAELRKKLMKETITFGHNRVTRNALLETLRKGQSIDFDGYEITHQLYTDFEQLELCATEPPPCPGLVVQLGPHPELTGDIEAFVRHCRSRNALLTVIARRERPFWNLIGLVDCPSLIDTTRAWIAERQPGAARAVDRRTSAASPTVRLVPPSDPGVPPTPPAPRPVTLTVAGQALRGLLHTPDAAGNGLGILFLHGWSGCKLGPHRMFVNAARQFAANGCHCLRIDFRGRGDSDGLPRAADIVSMTEDAAAAFAHLSSIAAVRAVAVLGICSGGKVAVSLAAREPRVKHLALWSAEALAPLRATTIARRKTLLALKQYAYKACRPATWRKLLTGRVNTALVRKAVLEHEQPDAREQRAEAATLKRLATYRGDVVLVYGGNDPETVASAQGYRTFFDKYGVPWQAHTIDGANHSFYARAWERAVIDLTWQWLDSRAPGVGDGKASP
jgi:exosortase A-associated hydrolase 2